MIKMEYVRCPKCGDQMTKVVYETQHKYQCPRAAEKKVRFTAERMPEMAFLHIAYKMAGLLSDRGISFTDEALSLCLDMLESTLYVAKATLPEGSPRRVFIQDFAASLNRKGLLANEDVDKFREYGYQYMD